MASSRANAIDLLMLNGKTPLRIELHIEIEGKSVPEIWDESFGKLFNFYDRNSDGFLDNTESARLPSAFVLRQVLWGQFAPVAGEPPLFTELDIDADGKVAADELADFYRRAGLGNAIVGIGKPSATEKLTEALLEKLDTNNDGNVDDDEWKEADKALEKLDKNEDELVGPGELIERLAYPGAHGSIFMTAPSPDSKPDPVTDNLPFIVLPIRNADTYWMTSTAERLESLATSQTIIDSRLRDEPPSMIWNVQLEATGSPSLAAGLTESAPKNNQWVSTIGNTLFKLRPDGGKLTAYTGANRKRILDLFVECDATSDRVLDEKELGATKAGQLKQLAVIADRNGDRNLDEAELTSWIELQEQVAKGHVLLTILDHGTGLFEFLDSDWDGSLSQRELRKAWLSLSKARLVTQKGFDKTKLPRQLMATISRGRPQSLLGKAMPSGPDWFVAMDRNLDGDVSQKEFLGPRENFNRYDLDADGLLSSDEVIRIQEK